MIGRTTPLQIIFVIFIIYHHGEIYLIKKAVKKHEYKEKYKHLLYQKKFLDGVFTAIKYNVMKG
ncbi:lipopolysaccharide 1,2-glucosyltransferase domain protein [Escherichia coli DEC12D]|nr:lipopolysaccharide 1,2-glucosyltransferase domain protein [Escherichia coli DEC12D]